MRHDIVELSEFAVDVVDAHLVKGKVFQAQFSDTLFSDRYRSAGEIYANEFAVGQVERHRNEIAGIPASEFQKPAMWDRRRLHPEQSR
jgi:hypothetical protein